MKAACSVFAAAMAAALWTLSGAAAAQCPPGQLDYDYTLGTFETLLGTVLVDTEGNNLWDAPVDPIWQNIPGQQGPGFLDVDNTGNGIDDDDHFDLLAAIIDGDESVVGGLNPATVTAIRNAFAANVATVQQREITISGVQINAVALGFFPINTTINVTTGSPACINVFGQQCFDVPSLWSINESGDGLLAEASPVLEKQLIDLSAAVMTIGDPAGVEYYQALLAQVTLAFIQALLPALLDNLKDGEKYTVPCGGIETISVDVSLTDPVQITGTITVPAANICAALQNFVNQFNCSNFNCQTGLLAASGDLNGDGTANAASYAASSDRQDWMSRESIGNPPLEIWGRPADATVVAGTPTTFGAQVAGGGGGALSHQWESLDLSELTTIQVLGNDAELTYAYPLESDSAALVYQVCDGLWQRRSKPAIFTVLPDVFQIVQQPVGAIDIPPVDFELSVVVIGGAAVPTYQWQFDDGNGFEDIVGANGPVLAFTPLTVADSGDYRCVIDGDDGAKAAAQLISDTATITVDPGLRITAQPVSGGVYIGENYTFTVETDGDIVGTVRYQWRFDDGQGGGFQDIPGEEGDTLTIDPATLDDNGAYVVIVEDDSRTLTSAVATLEVAERMEITEQPVGGIRLAGQSIDLTFGVSGGLGGVAYQWFKDDVAVPGANAATLSLSPLDFDDAGTYRCEATDATETLVSDDAEVEVANAFNFLTQPVGGARWTGESFTFTVAVDDGTPPFSYQWFRNGQPVGGDSPSLELTDLALSDAGTYYCEVQDQNGTAQSASAVLQVGPPLQFVSQPANAAVYVGSSHTFTTQVQGGVGTVNYTWRFGAFNLGVNATSYTIASAQPINQGNYTVTVSDARGQIVSAPATLTVAQPLQFTAQPQGGIRFEGASISMSVSVTQGLGSRSFAWFKNGVPLGVTTATLNLANLACASAGTYYCEVTDSIATSRSADAEVVVYPAPTGPIPVGVQLSGQQVVPVNASEGTGFGNGQLQLVAGPGQNFNLSMAVNILDVVITGVTINRAPAGQNGPVVFDLEQTGNSFTVFRTLTNAQAAELVGGLYYMVVKSPLFPNGEIRGQFTANYDTNCPEPEGEPEGEGEGTPEGEGEGTPEGEGEGTPEGEGEGTPEGEGEGTPEGEGEGTPEGEGEGTPEGEGEGTPEGEGAEEGEGEEITCHSADANCDDSVSLSELLRVIQIYNSGGYHCAVPADATEDGYVPGVNAAQQACTPHASDYNPQDWQVSLSELLRLIQFYNSGGYFACPTGEDGFCPGVA